MKRNIDLNDISDGKLYSSNDLVKTDCHGCVGCSDCCHGMGESIILDPIDVFHLNKATGKDFSALVNEGYLALNVVDGLILPNLNMNTATGGCAFLNEEGRCSVHSLRPGICRLFPLGRYYEEDGFKYFIQIHECSYSNRSKMKVKKWLEIPDIRTYEKYILDWHKFVILMEDYVTKDTGEDMKAVMMNILKVFYQIPYNGTEDSDFYKEFYRRLEIVKG